MADCRSWPYSPLDQTVSHTVADGLEIPVRDLMIVVNNRDFVGIFGCGVLEPMVDARRCLREGVRPRRDESRGRGVRIGSG